MCGGGKRVAASAVSAEQLEARIRGGAEGAEETLSTKTSAEERKGRRKLYQQTSAEERKGQRQVFKRIIRGNAEGAEAKLRENIRGN